MHIVHRVINWRGDGVVKDSKKKYFGDEILCQDSCYDNWSTQLKSHYYLAKTPNNDWSPKENCFLWFVFYKSRHPLWSICVYRVTNIWEPRGNLFTEQQYQAVKSSDRLTIIGPTFYWLLLEPDSSLCCRVKG